MSKPLVAIVGRPNVGKSMLFNKLCGKRLSIVEDTPGVTRDRLYAECEWCGRKFDIVDTGGIEPTTDNEILSFMREQANIAINAADVIILVTDVRTGVTAADREVANMLLRSGKPTVLAVNKMDSTGQLDPAIYEFYELGMGDPIAVSAVHGHGTGDLLDECAKYFPPEEEHDDEDDRIRVAVIGKPNVGKSSLINHILGEKRVIVSNMAGTTRDAVDSEIDNKFGKYVFIDTAGIRRKSKVDERVEKFSVMRAQMAIERADVCLIMIDAREGVTEQDTKIAGLAHEAGKASIIVVNKWDLIEKETGTLEKMRKEVAELMNIKEEEYDFLDGEMFLTNNKGKLGVLNEIRLNKRANPDNMPVEDRLIRNQRTNGLWEMNEKNLYLINFTKKGWSEYVSKNKDFFNSVIKTMDEKVLLNMYIIFFITMNFKSKLARFKLILEKTEKAIKKISSSYSKEIQTQFNEKFKL